jgi:hypothetical protein
LPGLIIDSGFRGSWRSSLTECGESSLIICTGMKALSSLRVVPCVILQ